MQNYLKKITTLLGASLFLITVITCTIEEITPYKFTDQECKKGLKAGDIPKKQRFTVTRMNDDELDIVYYMSKPNKFSFPIAILCGGSTSKMER